MIDCDNKVKDGNPDHDRSAKEYAYLKRRYHKKQHKCPGGGISCIYMIESFPATEIFFLWYFRYSSAFYTNQRLKEILYQKMGYLTEERYFIKHSIHDTLIEFGGNLENAISHSIQYINSSEAGTGSFSEIGIMVKCLLEGNFKNL